MSSETQRLPPGQQLVARGKWPPVGERAPAVVDVVWTVTVAGCVERECRFTLGELQSLPRIEQVVDIHCVTRWTKLDVHFSGVSLATLLGRALPTTAARFV